MLQLWTENSPAQEVKIHLVMERATVPCFFAYERQCKGVFLGKF